MKKKLLKVIKHPLISGSSIIFISSFVGNLLQYFFNLSMGRLLSVADYGLLTALTSLLVFFGVIQTSLTSIFAKFSVVYVEKKDTYRFSQMVSQGLLFVATIGCLFFLILSLATFWIADFLHIQDLRLVMMISGFVMFSIIFSLPAGILQGRMKFYTLATLNIANPVLKILFGIIFVVVGYKVFGAMSAVVLAVILPTIIGLFVTTRRSLSFDHINRSLDFIKELKEYGTKLFLSSIGIMLLTSIDIVLVRHFFSPVLAGQYAALSIMGKAIFYLTSPLYFVFFPLIAQKRERKESVLETLLLASAIVGGLSVAISFFYFFFPFIILAIFFPAEEYKVLAPYLGYYSLYIAIFSVAYLLNNFFLSIGKTGVYKLTLSAGIGFVILLMLFHKTLYDVINSLFVTALVLLISLFIYYSKHGKD